MGQTLPSENHLTEMRLGICARRDEAGKIFLAKLELGRGKAPAKKLMSQPQAIGIDNICLAIVRYFSNLALKVVTLDFTAIKCVRASRAIPSSCKARATKLLPAGQTMKGHHKGQLNPQCIG